MASEVLAPTPQGSLSDLSSRFDALASRIRRLALLRGLGRLVAIVSAMCAAGLLVDWFFPLSGPVRLGWLAAILCAAGFVLWSEVFRPVFRRFTIAELAAIVEDQYPELGERLTSAVELTDPAVPEQHKGSALMREWLEAETIASTKRLDFRRAVSSERARKSGLIAGIAAGVLLVPFLVMPLGYGQLWARLLMPWAAHELPAVLYFQVPEGDRVSARGEDLTLLALPPEDEAPEDLPADVELVWTTASGETDRRPMAYDEAQGGYVATVPHVFEDFEYIVRAPRKRSDRHRITVVDRPEILAFTLTITPPAYTGLEAHKVDGAVGDVLAFERSRIRADLEFNKPLKEAHWLWQEAQAVGPVRPTALPFQLSEDGKSARLDLVASAGSFAARVVDEFGLENLEEPPRNLILVTDQPPELTLAGQTDTTTARPRDVLMLEVRAKDDLAVSALELHIETAQGQTMMRPAPAEVLGQAEARQSFRLDLAEFDLSEGQWLKYRFRAADNRPEPGPNEVWSPEQRIIIDPEAEAPGSQEVAKRQNDLRDSLKAIREDLRKNREAVEKLQAEAEAKNAAGEAFEKQEELSKTQQQQEELSARLEELAVKFGEHRLFAKLTPETQRIAREPLKKAAEELKKNQPAAEGLQKSQQELTQAESDLEQLAKRFEDLAQLERDLQGVDRMAQEADRLADRASDLAEQRENPPPKETPEQKAAREAKIEHEQALLDEQRQQLTDGLDELLQHRPEILEAARKTALEEIAELSKQAAELAERQEALNESLKAEADPTDQQAKHQETEPPKNPPANGQEQNPQRPNDSEANTPPANNIPANDPQNNPSRPGDSNVNPSDANASRPEQSPAPAAAQKPNQNRPAPPESDQNPPGKNDSQPNPQRAEESVEEKPSLARRQAEQARKAAELAIQVARDLGSESKACQCAAEAARNASTAGRQISDGTLGRAAETAQKAAEAAKSTADALTEAGAEQLAQEAGRQAEDQTELAKELAEAAEDPAQRRAAQSEGQRHLADATGELAEKLAEAAEKLASTPLELKKPGEKTEAAGQAAAQATQQMKQAQADASEGNPAQAAAAGEKASEALRRAAGHSPASVAETPENTLVPGDLAEEVADARRRLEEAKKLLENARRQTQTADAGNNQPMDEGSEAGNDQKPMPGQNQDEGDQPGQSSPMSAGQNQPGQNQPGQEQNQPGQQPSEKGQSALAQSARSLEQAAQALSQAARQMQGGVPGQSNQAGQSSQHSSMPGQPAPGGSLGPGNQSPIPIEQLEAVLQRQDSEEWGRLPGRLQTEILQGDQQKTEGDYARLIKLYSEELLKKQQAGSQPK